MPRKNLTKANLKLLKKYGKMIRKSAGMGAVLADSSNRELIKEYYPHVPINMFRFIEPKTGAPPEITHPNIIDKKGVINNKPIEFRRNAGKRTSQKDMVNAINNGIPFQVIGKNIFIRKDEVRHVYTEKRVERALMIGINPEALERLTKSKLYIKEMVKKVVGDMPKKGLSKDDAKKLENWKEYIKRMKSKK